MLYALEVIVAVSACLMRSALRCFGGGSVVVRAVLHLASLVRLFHARWACRHLLRSKATVYPSPSPSPEPNPSPSTGPHGTSYAPRPRSRMARPSGSRTPTLRWTSARRCCGCQAAHSSATTPGRYDCHTGLEPRTGRPQTAGQPHTFEPCLGQLSVARALLPKLAEHLARESADGGVAQRGAAQRGVPRILVYRYPLPARNAASDDGRQAASVEAVAACLSLLCAGHRTPHRARTPDQRKAITNAYTRYI